MWHNLRASVSLIHFRVEVTHWATKWSFACFLNLNFLSRFKTVIPEECSFHKVVPQDHRDCATHLLVCHLPQPCVHLSFRGLKNKCIVLAFKGAQHLTHRQIPEFSCFNSSWEFQNTDLLWFDLHGAKSDTHLVETVL